MIIEVTGKMVFDPENVTRKHESQSEWKHFAMIMTGCDLPLYYAWFIKKRFGLSLNKPLRGSHVTFISDKMCREVFEQGKSIFDGKTIKFYIDPEPRSNGEHWWLRVYCPEIESVRESMGLSREPFFNLHFTIGHATAWRIQDSEYVLENCKRFELIDSSNRKPMETHEIIKFENDK